MYWIFQDLRNQTKETGFLAGFKAIVQFFSKNPVSGHDRELVILKWII